MHRILKYLFFFRDPETFTFDMQHSFRYKRHEKNCLIEKKNEGSKRG